VAASLPQPDEKSNPFDLGRRVLIVLLAFLAFGGCRMTAPYMRLGDLERRFAAGTIVAAGGTVVDQDRLLADLAGAEVVYIGETHTNTDHHRIQIEIIERLKARRPDLSVAMEMFDTSYQPILDRWSRGELEEAAFLEKTHWYANWRFDVALYRDILSWIKATHTPLIALNLPFYRPSRIAVGGLENLSAADRAFLPERIDTSDPAHRAMIEPTLAAHRHLKGRDNLDYLYQAQCAWADAMAAQVARTGRDRLLVVLIGIGHIAHKHGVPKRAFARNGALFRTVFLAEAGGRVDPDVADYIWVTQPLRPAAGRPLP